MWPPLLSLAGSCCRGWATEGALARTSCLNKAGFQPTLHANAYKSRPACSLKLYEIKTLGRDMAWCLSNLFLFWLKPVSPDRPLVLHCWEFFIRKITLFFSTTSVKWKPFNGFCCFGWLVGWGGFFGHTFPSGILVPLPGIKSEPTTMKAPSLNHWAAREFPGTI